MDDRDWKRLVDQLRKGDCTPFLGAGACSGTLPTGSELSREWAALLNYPFEDVTSLPDVMQYAAVDARDAVEVKKQVVSRIISHGQPDFSDPHEPHIMLAGLPLPVYLTTNYDNFMTDALKTLGKQPLTAVCPWYRSSWSRAPAPIPAAHVPGESRPIVYHLHGSNTDPRSLVLTDQDYVEFLVTFAMARGSHDDHVIPTSILSALTKQPLLFIGYSLRDWSFKVLFHGLVRALSDVQRRRHVSVQLAPPTGDLGTAATERAKKYQADYFEQLNISVFWGSAREFCQELASRMEAM